jgi:hypothetical protein
MRIEEIEELKNIPLSPVFAVPAIAVEKHFLKSFF